MPSSRSSAGDNKGIGARKAQHLEICIQGDRYDVEGGRTMMDHLAFVHRALPEIDADSIDTRCSFLGHTMSLPLFISSMTGGSEEAYRANRDLAAVAQETGVGVGMGSIRILFRKPDVIDHFMLKRIAPDVPVFANIGGVQLREDDHAPLVELVKRLEVDGLAVHLNPGQELIQPEGDRNFRGVLSGIGRLCEALPVPVIVKETGFGIGPGEVRRLLDAGAAYVDVAGSGGTNWVTVEAYRLADHDRAVAREFADWGIPTAVCLAAAREHTGRILASGGLRTGMDVAKSVALGAVAAGFALPFIRRVAADGVAGGVAAVEHVRDVLRSAMVLTGSENLSELRRASLVATVEFSHFLEQVKHDG